MRDGGLALVCDTHTQTHTHSLIRSAPPRKEHPAYRLESHLICLFGNAGNSNLFSKKLHELLFKGIALRKEELRTNYALRLFTR